MLSVLILALALGPAPARATPASGRAEFDTTSFRLVEATYPVVMTVSRPGGLDAGPATVDYATLPSSAAAHEDFRPVSGTLIFGVGDRTKTFVVPILDDGVDEANEELWVVLSNPRGAFTTSGERAVVVIEDDDDPAPAVAAARPVAPRAAGAASPPTTAPAPAATAGRRPAVVRRAPTTRTVRRVRPTTLELQRPALGEPRVATSKPADVDGGLVLVAALLLGRAAAGVWFERRQFLFSPRRFPAPR